MNSSEPPGDIRPGSSGQPPSQAGLPHPPPPGLSWRREARATLSQGPVPVPPPLPVPYQGWTQTYSGPIGVSKKPVIRGPETECAGWHWAPEMPDSGVGVSALLRPGGGLRQKEHLRAQGRTPAGREVGRAGPQAWGERGAGARSTASDSTALAWDVPQRPLG